jgi:hypothetical protein
MCSHEYITLLVLKLYIKSNDFLKPPLLQTSTYYHPRNLSINHYAKPNLTTWLQWPTVCRVLSLLSHTTNQIARRQNAFLLSVLAAGGAGYWLIKARSQQRDQRRQEQIYVQEREHINTTKKGDH